MNEIPQIVVPGKTLFYLLKEMSTSDKFSDEIHFFEKVPVNFPRLINIAFTGHKMWPHLKIETLRYFFIMCVKE